MATDFPKVTFMKKLLLSAMFFGVFSMQQVHAANVMEGIFKGMVASTDPASVRTASRVGAVGGSFSYRQPQVNTNLVNVSFTVNNFPVQPPCPNPKRSTGVISELTPGNCGEVGFHLSQI